ncbi:MAG: hypothetical protein VW715_06230 [Rhodospirillales bacterium]
MQERHEQKSILQLAAEIKALADASRRPPLCDHRWEYVPDEYESMAGRGTVLQYEGGMYCKKCDQWEDEV